MTDSMIAKWAKDEENDPFYDGESHLPSGKEIAYNPAPIKPHRRSKFLSSASTFNAKTRAHWEGKGYIVEKVETMGMVNRAVTRQDFCGSFDFIAISGSGVVLIQVSSKDKVRDHLSKMLGGKEYRPGRTRRMACDFFAKIGWKMVIHWYDQPGGDGTKWVDGIEELTPELIADIDAGRRTRRVK